MKRAIQFGAGNIGRGFIGAVLSEAGYHVVFADVNKYTKNAFMCIFVYREPAGVEISTYYGLHMLSQSYKYTVIYQKYLCL